MLKVSISVAIQKRLKILCSEKGWSLSELSRRSRVPKSSLSTLMHNPTQCISTSNLAKITEAFEMTLAEFFDDEIFSNLAVR